MGETRALLLSMPDLLDEAVNPLGDVAAGLMPVSSVISEDGRTILLPVILPGELRGVETHADRYLGAISAPAAIMVGVFSGFAHWVTR